MLGGIERGTDKMFLVPVPQCDSATLIPIVQRYVCPGTMIYTDLWRVYDSVGQCGFVHGMVNHSQNFVDPVTRVQTNSIEGSWTHTKKKLKHHDISDKLFGLYMAEYLWRRFGKETPFAHLINHNITCIYPRLIISYCS